MLSSDTLAPTAGPLPAEQPPLPRWFVPATFIAGPVILSFGAWWMLALSRDYQPASASAQELTGFGTPSQSSAQGIALLALWYTAVISVATIGWRLGRPKRPLPRVASVSETAVFQRSYFLVILTAAAAGVGYSYLKIMRNASILESLASQSGNNFTNSLSGSTGLETLRYAAILAAPIGVYLWRKKVLSWRFAVAGLVILAANSLIASRLSLLMASVVFLALWVRGNRGQGNWSGGKKIAAALLIFLVGFSALAVLNYFRNANYYREAGVTSPVAMNLYQMGSYLGVPAQVSIGVADAVMHGAWEKTGSPVSSFNAVQPTFLQFKKIKKDDSWKGANVYGNAVVFAPQMFTNSVFADTYADWGMWGWPYTVVLYGIAGYMMARLTNYPGVIAGSGGVLAYCFSEVWRIQIVSYGFVIFLLLLTAGAAFIAMWAAERAERRVALVH